MTDFRDSVTGLTDDEHAALARELYGERDHLGGDEVEAVVEPEVRSVISVRFNRAELGTVAAAAQTAGIALSTYIRNAALEAAGAVDIDAARKDLASLMKRIEQLRKHLGDAA
jgi:ribosomal protein S15P/S13E